MKRSMSYSHTFLALVKNFKVEHFNILTTSFKYENPIAAYLCSQIAYEENLVIFLFEGILQIIYKFKSSFVNYI